MQIRLLLLVITSLSAGLLYGQDTVQFKAPIISPSIHWDYGKTATTWTAFESKTELGFNLMILDRYELVTELGRATLNPNQGFKNIRYEVDGQYLRVGLGYLGYIDPKNRIGLRVMYGQSQFEDSGAVLIDSESNYNLPYERAFARTDLMASWGEVVIVSQRYVTLKKSASPDAWINRVASIGALFRYRQLLASSDTDNIPPYYAIPGYGRATSDQLVAFNVFLRIMIF
ncbi:MAG: hypothetical protein ACJAZM_002361 [Cyclobacteriaceae bacterium]|jgi:hypothetical protein